MAGDCCKKGVYHCIISDNVLVASCNRFIECVGPPFCPSICRAIEVRDSLRRYFQGSGSLTAPFDRVTYAVGYSLGDVIPHGVDANSILAGSSLVGDLLALFSRYLWRVVWAISTGDLAGSESDLVVYLGVGEVSRRVV